MKDRTAKPTTAAEEAGMESRIESRAEPEAPPGGTETASESTATETTQGDSARTEWDVLHDRYLRLAAEFENHKKRTAREHQARVQSANADLLFDLLDVADNFERALQAEHQESLYARGVALIYDQLQGVLLRRGVVALTTEGQRFDPEVHEALLHLPSEEVPAGYVCRELRRGYSHHGRTLRPAQVAVSSGPGAGATPVPAPGAGEHEQEIESGAKNE